MKAVAEHALLAEFARNGEELGDPRMRPVERRIEAGDLRQIGKALGDRLDRREVVRLMQGGKRRQLGEIGNDATIDAGRPAGT